MKDSYDSAGDDCTSSESLLPPQEVIGNQTPRQRRCSSFIPWILPTLLSAVLLVTLFVKSRIPEKKDDLACIKAQSAWSPALEAAAPLRLVRFNGTLNYPSEFRGSPKPEVDAAWETLVNRESIGAFGVSDSDFQKLDQDLTGNTTRMTSRQGKQLLATMEVYHQLHCLNLIRKYTYKDYYETRSRAFQDGPVMLRIHVDHCIEILRQKLICDADVGVITYNWVAVRDLPWPNFNTVHKCRNFDGIVEWSKKNNAPSFGETLKRPDGVVGLENPP